MNNKIISLNSNIAKDGQFDGAPRYFFDLINNKKYAAQNTMGLEASLKKSKLRGPGFRFVSFPQNIKNIDYSNLSKVKSDVILIKSSMYDSEGLFSSMVTDRDTGADVNTNLSNRHNIGIYVNKSLKKVVIMDSLGPIKPFTQLHADLKDEFARLYPVFEVVLTSRRQQEEGTLFCAIWTLDNLLTINEHNGDISKLSTADDLDNILLNFKNVVLETKHLPDVKIALKFNPINYFTSEQR